MTRNSTMSSLRRIVNPKEQLTHTQPYAIMRTILKKLASTALLSAAFLFVAHSNAQLLMSARNDSQDFNSLEKDTVCGNSNWVDNVTSPGWYASPKGSGAIAYYWISTGSAPASSFHSCSARVNSDHALGSLAGGSSRHVRLRRSFRQQQCQCRDQHLGALHTQAVVAESSSQETCPKWGGMAPNFPEPHCN